MGALEAMLQENQVVDFLKQHPDFFLRHKALLDELAVPHEQRGAVSLFDLKLERQRDRLQQLEQERQELLTNATRNEFIFRVYTDIYPALFACTSLRQLWKCMHSTFRERLRIPACALWVNQARVKAKRFDKPYEMEYPLFQRLCLYPMADQLVYFGRVNDCDRELIFGQGSWCIRWRCCGLVNTANGAFWPLVMPIRNIINRAWTACCWSS